MKVTFRPTPAGSAIPVDSTLASEMSARDPGIVVIRAGLRESDYTSLGKYIREISELSVYSCAY